uniref:Uncharacterized protein n=1 Tax=Anguilla anguilla TaxID=7936 RepID=A0A0E9TNI5_ANGAN
MDRLSGLSLSAQKKKCLKGTVDVEKIKMCGEK